MKKCKECNSVKKLSEFHVDRAKKDGRKTNCKICAKLKANRWRRENRERDSQTTMKRKKRYIKRNRAFVAEFLINNPCSKCGEADLEVLEFDHLRDKKHGICNMLSGDATGYSLKTIKEEIAKCQVLCSNCHKRKTAKEQGWWILQHTGV